MDEPIKKKSFLQSAGLEIIISKRLIIRAIFTATLMAIFVYILWLLFHKEIQSGHRDILNVIIGSFLGILIKSTDFWFKRDDEDARVDKADPLD